MRLILDTEFKGAYRRKWRFPEWLEESLPRVLEHPCLHICAGESDLGDVRLDRYTDVDVRADMFNLPFRDESFQCVLIDPPWHLPNHLRPSLLWELRRVLKGGGLLLLNSIWIPKIPRLDLERVAIMMPRQFWTNVSALGFYRKNQRTLRTL